MKREAEPHDDDLAVRSIEIQFAIPVFIPQEAQRELHDLVGAIVKLKRNQVHDCFHWVSSYGSKPNWNCQADQALLGLPIDPTLPRGPVEPTFDASVFSIETAFREMHDSEKRKRDERAGQPPAEKE